MRRRRRGDGDDSNESNARTAVRTRKEQFERRRDAGTRDNSNDSNARTGREDGTRGRGRFERFEREDGDDSIDSNARTRTQDGDAKSNSNAMTRTQGWERKDGRGNRIELRGQTHTRRIKTLLTIIGSPQSVIVIHYPGVGLAKGRARKG